jgi:mRNA interferase HigB
MRLISVKPLRKFWEEKHSDAEQPLRHWVNIVKKAPWKNLAAVRLTFSSTDQYKQFVIFNIAGNKYRLIAAIHYNTGCVYVRHILMHAEYDSDKWKKS